jgi:geranylgeranyl reductase
MFDIAIVGAGPAGSTLARLLGRSCKIALFDKRGLDEGGRGARNEKCCGGLLAPDAQAALASLSLGLPRAVIVEPQLFAVRSVDLPSGRERLYRRPYINVDRLEFDRWLWSLVPEGTLRFPACLVTGLARGRRGWIVSYRRAGRAYAIEARVVAGTDGSRSLVRKRLDCRPPQLYFAVEEWFDYPSSPPFFSAVFDAEITDYYAWTIPKDGRLLVGAALDPADRPLEKFELLKRKLRERGWLLGRPVARRSAFLGRPRRASSVCLGRGDLALAGEAAGLVSPSSGEGLSFALESAAFLADAVLRDGPDFQAAYARAAAGLRRKIFLKNLKVPFFHRPWLRRAALVSGVFSLRPRVGEGKEARERTAESGGEEPRRERQITRLFT